MVGRPTKYNEEMLTLANAYIDQHLEYGSTVPNAAGMALALNVSKKTLCNWGEDHPEFLHTLDRLNEKQEDLLISKGITSEFNSTITKLMLANHGYHDKQDLKHEGGVSMTVSNEDADML